ncbi:SDH family Clp fold serine proteinase [Peteryoungia aggregata]|nr:hypothetical protein [Peteryoungia aggregata]
MNARFAEAFDGTAIILRSPMRFGLDDVVRQQIELIAEEPQRDNGKLVVMLETTGGYIETVERIYSVFRRHFTAVEFVIPNYAYSAGTVLALSGDEIHMDYYSVLGPIDPQVEDENGGGLVPGLGYLAKYNELCATINEEEQKRISGGDFRNVSAEIAYLLKKFDPGKLYHIEHAIEHSISLLKEWLPRHKFKNWTKTETRGTDVTVDDRIARASQIAECLGNAARWHSHGRGIGMRELASEEIKLLVHDFGAEPKTNQAVRDYYNLFIDFGDKMGSKAAIHTHRSGFVPIA